MAESNVSKFGTLSNDFNTQFKQQGYELKNKKNTYPIHQYGYSCPL